MSAAHFHTLCKQPVIDRSLHPTLSVCVCVCLWVFVCVRRTPPAGPAPVVHTAASAMSYYMDPVSSYPALHPCDRLGTMVRPRS